ncbi:HTH-type transcriptional repressor yvoA [uncultured Eubacterium sp.]|uniref:GntR family transcriptional regulator n=1 Tax=Brotomerdimonas butyrica TaxID=2981721 RepID=UPI0008210876|nr:GntR family transcriptional regulator [Brotomerdimonas butyrica]MCU6754827.1 GntR family transcriptional regulator [Brotomerdimonas butyrica]SCG95119.1 HTH-type transcriptional repressor yvoA [uncultured Eubacterium sp.]
MEWKLDDSRPIWPQLKEQLIIAIVAGRFQMGGSFPTVRELAEDAGVNRNTMQRALSELEHDGFVITNRTAGRTVTTDEGLVARMKEQIAMQNIEKFIREMEAIGYGADDIVKMIQERGVEKK